MRFLCIKEPDDASDDPKTLRGIDSAAAARLALNSFECWVLAALRERDAQALPAACLVAASAISSRVADSENGRL